jgi:type I restriction enzyme S subunit
MSNKTTIKLGDIAEIKGGKRLPKGNDVQNEITDHPYLRVVDFKEDGLDTTNVKYIDKETHQKVKNYTISSEDIYLSIAGTIGRVGIILEKLSGANLTENAAKITNINKEFNKKYLMYFLRGSLGQGQIQSRVGGTSQPKLALYKIKDIEIPKLSRPEQDKIVSTLSGYDDLIENNRRRIQLLEESARLLYREWFVHFRFPGHEHVEIVDGLPQGWGNRTLIELSEVIMGQSPKSEFYNQDGQGLPFHQGVSNYGVRFVDHDIYCSDIKRIAEFNDILCSVRAPVGRLNITLDKIVIGRGLSAVRSRTNNQSFLYYQLKNFFFKEDMMGSGAIFAAVTKNDLENLKLITPTQLLINQFEQVSRPIDIQIANLHQQNQKLKQARDILLPRLMNGEITV